MFTKTFLLILASHCLLAAAESAKPDVEEASEKCRNQYNLTKEEIQHLEDSKMGNTPDNNIKCFMKCFMNEMKLMNEKGELMPIPSDLDPEVRKHFESCANVTGTDPCDKAFNFSRCLGMEKKQQKSGP